MTLNSVSPTLHPSTTRLYFLDFLKAMSIAAVVSFHAIFVPSSTYEPHAVALDTLFAPLRFCVPIFLTISFILAEHSFIRKPASGGLPWLQKRLARLLIPTLFWFTLMSGLKLATGTSIAELIPQLLTGEIFTGGYFLLVLLQLTLVFFLLRTWLNRTTSFIVAIALQVLVYTAVNIALLRSPNSAFIETLRVLDRPLIFYWFGYVALGIFMAHRLSAIVKTSLSMPLRSKAIVLLLTAVMLTVEYAWIGRITGGDIPPFDYLLFSCLICVPVLMICFASLQEKHLSPALHTAVHLLSKYSLGIFCINGVLSQIFLSIGSKLFDGETFTFPEILGLRLVGWAVLLLLSLGGAMAIERVGLKAVVC